jgi:hypothetical protein
MKLEDIKCALKDTSSSILYVALTGIYTIVLPS